MEVFDENETEEIESKNMIHLTVLGEAYIGKTSLIRHLLGKPFTDDLHLTVGANFNLSKIKVNREEEVRLRICDIAGQTSFEPVRHNYMVNSQGALLVFDITNANSFKNVNRWLEQFWLSNPDSAIPILLVGNKSDLALDKRQVKLTDVRNFLRLAEKKGKIRHDIIGYIETSAKTGKNVKEAFEKITNVIIQEHEPIDKEELMGLL